MAMMTATRFLEALRAEGLTVHTHDGWETHNRNSKGAWGPLNGVMLHHTAGGQSGAYNIMSKGLEGLPGPLCQGLINKDGSIDAVGWGRANHAGGGDPDVLAAVKAERYPLPRTNEHQGSDGSVDGNAHFVGFECVNKGDGKDPWPAVQLEAMARACAAVCRAFGWTVNSVLRHMDWSDWKPDPKGVDWEAMRDRIKTILAGPPNATPMPGKSTTKPPVKKPGTKPPTSAPKPPANRPPVVSVSRVIAASKRDPGLPQGGTTHPADVKLVEAALLKLGFLAKAYASDGSFGTKTQTAYNAFRRSIGLRGADATGTPGKLSLSTLGSRSGLFTVKN